MQATKAFKTVGNYKIFEPSIGEGMMGKVYAAQLISNPNKYYAVKEVPLAKINEAIAKQISNEVENLSKLKSPFIVELIEFTKTGNNFYMILEFCEDGDLKQYLKRRSTALSENEALVVFRHIVEGFKKLCAEKILHRDIKPANILLKQGVAKITDFGFSRVVEDIHKQGDFTLLGTPLYTAPQILKKQTFSSKCDVWSVGILFYQLLYGRPPWTGVSLEDLTKNIHKVQLQFKGPIQRSERVQALIRRMLALEEKDRISWDEIFEDPLCKDQITTIKKTAGEYTEVLQVFQRYIQNFMVGGYLKISTKIKEEMDNADLARREPNAIAEYRRQILDVFLRLMHERNVAFFYCYILGLLYRNEGRFPTKFNKDKELEFVICKRAHESINAIILSYFKQGVPANTDPRAWNEFLRSSDCAHIQEILRSDTTILTELLNAIAAKVRAIYIDKKGAERLMKNADKLEGEFWKKLSNDIIKENIAVIDNDKKNPTNVALLIKECLEVATNPYARFSSEMFDFQHYYESLEQTYELKSA